MDLAAGGTVYGVCRPNATIKPMAVPNHHRSRPTIMNPVRAMSKTSTGLLTVTLALIPSSAAITFTLH